MVNENKSDKLSVYEIRVKGILEERWSDWFDGFSIKPQAGDITYLSGKVKDQAALHGLLAKIRDLGLVLISIQAMKSEEKKQQH